MTWVQNLYGIDRDPIISENSHLKIHLLVPLHSHLSKMLSALLMLKLEHDSTLDPVLKSWQTHNKFPRTQFCHKLSQISYSSRSYSKSRESIDSDQPAKLLSADEEEADTDLETDRLLGQQRLDDHGFGDDKVSHAHPILSHSISHLSSFVLVPVSSSLLLLLRAGRNGPKFARCGRRR